MASLLRPKRPAWMIGAGITAVAAVIVYALWGGVDAVARGPRRRAHLRDHRCLSLPERRPLPAAPAAALVAARYRAAVAAAPHLRRNAGDVVRLHSRRLRTATRQHGLVGCSACHCGPPRRGAAGTMLQKWIPLVIAGSLRVEALAVRVPELTARLLAQADNVMRGASDARLLASYQTDVRPVLERPEPAWSTLRTSREAAGGTMPVSMCWHGVSDRDRAGELRALVAEKAELDVHLSLQRALRVWLLVHVPPAIALLGLLGVHIFAVLYL